MSVVSFIVFVVAVAASTPPTIPNIGYLGRGYNIILGNPNANKIDPGFENPVIKLTYLNHNTSASGKWQIPDNTNVIPTDACSYEASSSLIFGSQSYQQSLQANVDAQASVGDLWWKAAFSGSADFKKISQQSTTNNYCFTAAKATCYTYDASLDTYLMGPHSLDENFRVAVRDLPASFDDDPEAYLDFLGNFGTHFVVRLMMGGQITQMSYFDQETMQQIMSDGLDVSLAASASFGIFSGSFSGSEQEKQQVLSEFNSQRKDVEQYYVGGAPFVNASISNEWFQSLQAEPMPISGIHFQLQSISSLFTTAYFPDDPDIGTKKLSLDATFEPYCSESKCQTDPKDPISQLPPSFYAVLGVGGVGLNGSVYVFGGYDSFNASCLTTASSLNLPSNQWFDAGSLFYAGVVWATGIVEDIRGDQYVFAVTTSCFWDSYTTTYLIQYYDPRGGWWSAGPSFNVSTLEYPTGVVVYAAIVGSQAFVFVSGASAYIPSAETITSYVWQFGDQAISQLPNVTASHPGCLLAAASLDGEVYVATTTTLLKNVSGTWKEVNKVPPTLTKMHPQVIAAEGKLFFFCYTSSGAVFVYAYDPTAENWESYPHARTKRHSTPFVTLIAPQTFLIGGGSAPIEVYTVGAPNPWEGDHVPIRTLNVKVN